MAGNKFNGYTNYGFGVGLRASHYKHILEVQPAVDWFEIISENYMIDGGRPLQILDEILDKYRVIQHGVALYFGSTDPYDREHLRRLKDLIRRTRTPFVSDHLCWGSIDGRYTHDLLPIPYTREAALNAAARIAFVRDYLEVPICVENISSYAEFKESEMTEWQFLSEVSELADCGILLDVNNIYVASQNHGFDPFHYLLNIPHNRVGQIHIAGHSVYDDYILDTHDEPVCETVWNLYARAVELTGPVNTLVEWDARIPPFEIVHEEVLKAKQFIGARV